MKELNQTQMLETEGGFFEIAFVIACTYMFYRYMSNRGYFQAQDFGGW